LKVGFDQRGRPHVQPFVVGCNTDDDRLECSGDHLALARLEGKNIAY